MQLPFPFFTRTHGQTQPGVITDNQLLLTINVYITVSVVTTVTAVTIMTVVTVMTIHW